LGYEVCGQSWTISGKILIDLAARFFRLIFQPIDTSKLFPRLLADRQKIALRFAASFNLAFKKRPGCLPGATRLSLFIEIRGFPSPPRGGFGFIYVSLLNQYGLSLFIIVYCFAILVP
jgi:hypothetical protein